MGCVPDFTPEETRMPLRHLRIPPSHMHVLRKKARRRFSWFGAFKNDAGAGRWARRAIIVAAALFAVGAISLVVLFAWFSRSLPDPYKIAERAVSQSTKIYDRTGETVLYEVHGDKRRTVIPFQQIPSAVKWATISAEDRDFFHHKGFDLRGIARAALSNLIHLNPSGQGGSTITQQFVKQAILSSEKTYTRKLKELVLAYQIERKFTKDEILGLYLNEIPYGSSAYGIEAASETYFGKHAKDLSLAESALLAGLPRAPTRYSPYGSNTELMYERQRFILDVMAKEKHITQEQAVAAKQEKITFKPRREGIIAPHFVFYVRQILAEKYGENVMEQGGLKVITTLDIHHQDAAEAAVAQYAPRNEKLYHASNAAMVSLDTKTGQILAMVGSRDYFDTEHDGNVNVTIQPRQPGSSFKPIVYTTAFDRGYTPETMVFDLVTDFGVGGTPYTPHNYNNKENGPISLRRALAGSLNIPAVKVLYLAGVNNVLDVAERFGYTTLQDRSRFGLSLVLGGAEVKLLEHTSAYATLAREGLRHPTTPILRVEDKNGRVLEQYKKQETRVMGQEAVRKTTSVLTDNNARSFIFGSHSPLILSDRLVAAKTGTTNDFRDGWTLGYTPSLAAGVWVGNNDNSPLVRGADGVVVAAPIWHAYMAQMLKGTPVESFTKPSPDPVEKPILKGQIDEVQKLLVDRVTGKVIPENCRDTYPKEYTVLKDFKQTHDILFWVDKNDPRGPVPKDPSQDPQFAGWEGPVQRWASQHGYPSSSKLQYERCDLRAHQVAPTVGILDPAAESTISVNPIVLRASASGNQKIAKVDFYLDGILLHSVTASPYEYSFSNAEYVNGTHALRVVATDALGVTGESSEQVTFSFADELRQLLLVTPQSDAVFQVSDFPLDILVHAFAPSGVKRITVTHNDTVLDTAESPPTTSVTLHVAALDKGTQTIVVHMESVSGATSETTLSLSIQ